MMKLRNIEFGNVFAASGAMNFFGEGWWYDRIFRFLFGWFGYLFREPEVTFVAKTTTWDARDGVSPGQGNMPLNESNQPRDFFPKCVYIDWLRAYIVNAVGLTGPGAQALFDKGNWQQRKHPFVISFMAVGKTSYARRGELLSFIELFQRHLKFFRSPVALEMNFSCPNAGHKQEELFSEISSSLDLAKSLRIPLIVKLNVLADHAAVKKLAESGKCDAIVMSNTIPWGSTNRIDWSKYGPEGISPLRDRGVDGDGGLSGAPIFPLVLEWIRKACREYGITLPIIACGGIMDEIDVIELEHAGASAIALGSGKILRPWRLRRIITRANEVFGGKE